MDEWLPFISDKLKRYIVLGLSALGLLISIIIRLFIESNTDSTLPVCKVGSIVNCDSVINSPYGHIFGIPLSLLGAFYFICLLAVYAVDYRNDYVIAILAIVGILSVLDLLYIEFILQHICLYCTSIHIIVVLIFILIGPPAVINSYQELKSKYLTK